MANLVCVQLRVALVLLLLLSLRRDKSLVALARRLTSIYDSENAFLF